MNIVYYCAGKASAKDMAEINKLKQDHFVWVADANQFDDGGRYRTFNADKALYPKAFAIIGSVYAGRGVDCTAYDYSQAKKTAKTKAKAR